MYFVPSRVFSDKLGSMPSRRQWFDMVLGVQPNNVRVGPVTIKVMIGFVPCPCLDQ